MSETSPAPPSELTRRHFLKSMAGGFVATIAAPQLLLANHPQVSARKSLIVGAGRHRYEWISDWAKLPAGMQLGSCHGGIVIDSQNRVLLNTETENAVMIFDADGKFVKAWGKDFKGGTHGMMRSESVV